MKEPEIRKWLIDHKLADQWWVMLDNEELNEDPITLDQVFKIHKTAAGKEIVIVQVKELDKDDPKYFNLDSVVSTPVQRITPKVAAKRISKRPAKAPPKPEQIETPAAMPPAPGDIPEDNPPLAMPPAPGESPPAAPIAPEPPVMPQMPFEKREESPPLSMPDTPSPFKSTPPPPREPTPIPPLAKEPLAQSSSYPSQPTAATPTSISSSIPVAVPPPTVPQVTQPSGSGGLSGQLQQAKQQLATCENAKEEATRHTQNAEQAAITADQNLQHQQKLLEAARTEKEQRDKDHISSRENLLKAENALKQAAQLQEDLQKKVEQTTTFLNNTEKDLAKAQDEHAKWKNQIENRDQQLQALKASAEQTQSILRTLQDDETLVVAASQSQAAAKAMETALQTARAHESETNRKVQQLTIQVADLRKSLNG